jgi:hypothetical protein
VRTDGTIDYVSAINAMYGGGLTPENNAAIPLLEAIGKEDGNGATALLLVRQALGMKREPRMGRLVSLFEFVRVSERDGFDREAFGKEESFCSDNPWTADRSPMIAKWLTTVQEQLDLFVSGSRRDRFFVPLVGEGSHAMVMNAQYAYFNAMRELCNGLKLRAMLRLGSNDLDGFRSDALALIRLGRVSSESPTMVQKLVATGCEAIGLATVRAGATTGLLSAEQCRDLLADVRAMPPSSPIIDSIDHAERFNMLDVLGTFAAYGPAQAGRLMKGDAMGVRPLAPSGKDWDAGMRRVNQWYDRMIDAGKLATHSERSAAADRVVRDAEEFKNKYSGILSPLAPLESRFVPIMLPAFARGMTGQTRILTDRHLTELALALRAIRSDRGNYPAKLEELSPKYVKNVPVDPFSEQPLLYRLEGAGYLLYSIGPNGKDDHGSAEPAGDDLSVRAAK